MSTKTKTRKATQPEIRLDDLTTTKAVQLPSSWDKVRAFASANVVDPIKTRTQQAVTKTKSTVSSARNLHAVSPKDATISAYEATERISSEAFGAVSGALKGLTGGIIGATGGLIAGVKGISPAVVKRLRLADATDLTRMGSWDAIRPTGDDLRVRMSLTVDPFTGEAIEPSRFSTSMSNRTDDEMVIAGRKRHVVLLPFAQSDTQTGIWVIVNDPEMRDVYLWFDN